MAYEEGRPSGDLKSSMQHRPGRSTKIERAKEPGKALARLAALLLPYRFRLAFVTSLVVLSSLVALLSPWLLGRAIDALAAGKAGTLPAIAAAMFAAYLGSNLLQAGANWLMAKVSQTALRSLRDELFAHIQRLPLAYFDARPAGALMSRLTNDVDAVNQAVSQNVTSLLASLVGMAGIVIAMFALNPLLALTTLVVVPLMFLFARFVSSYTRKGFRNLQAELASLNAVAEESISGQRVIRAFGRNDSVMRAFAERNEAVYRAGVYANSVSMLFMPLTGVLGNLFVILLAGFGGFLALSGLASVGTIATFVNYGQNFINPLRQIANLYNALQAALAGAERVFAVLDEKPEPGAETPLGRNGSAGKNGASAGMAAGGPPPVGPGRERKATEVVFDRVGFSYVQGRPVLEDFSLRAEGGRMVVLVGPTGAGKTTVINLLTRFYEIDSGTITVGGRNLADISPAEIRSRVALVLQDTFLFADTVMENIRYGRLDATDEECREAARVAEADHFIRQLPRGYDTPLSERAGNLSQGQRQLLSIARAVLADPEILILDEATSSVDTRTELRLQRALLQLMEGRTSFVIAHRLSTIRDASQVVVIDRGKIVERGTHAGLLEAGGFYARLYLSQFKGNAI